MKHICNPCGGEFDTEEEYIDHTCEKSGTTPADPENLVKTTTPNFFYISEKALERGAEREEE